MGIFCYDEACNCTVSLSPSAKKKGKKETCGRTGRSLGSCPVPERHIYRSRFWDTKIARQGTPVHHKTRDFWEYRKAHRQARDEQLEKNRLFKLGLAVADETQSNKSKEDNDKPIPVFLNDAIRMWIDFFSFRREKEEKIDRLLKEGRHEEAEEERKKTLKGYETYELPLPSKQIIADRRTRLKHFKEALNANDVNPLILRVSSFNKRHVAHFIAYLNDYRTSKGQPYSAKNHNHHIDTISEFFRWLIEDLEMDIKNYFSKAPRRTVITNAEAVWRHDFEKMQAFITQENGWMEKKSNSGRHKNGVQRENLFRSWTSDAFELSFYTGARMDELLSYKWSDVHPRYIKHMNLKVLRGKKQAHWTYVAMTKQLAELLTRMGWEENKDSSDYILAPEVTEPKKRKTTVGGLVSKSFNHFWNLAGGSNTIKWKHLEKSYESYRKANLPDKLIEITGRHFDTSNLHYTDKELVFEQQRGEDYPDLFKKS